MSAGAAIAAMAEQARTKACDKNMLKPGESSDTFEMVVEVLGCEPGQGRGKGRSIYLRLQESRTHWTTLPNPRLVSHIDQASACKALSVTLRERIYDTGERRPAVLIAMQPQAHKSTSIRP
jgi:hypothetical protein